MDPTLSAYNNSAQAYDNKFKNNAVYNDKIKDFASRLPAGSHILDLGCGAGISSEIMQKAGHVLTGLDYSESMLSLARQRCPDQLFIQGSVMSLDNLLKDYDQTTPFDALCLSFLIVHLNQNDCLSLLDKLNTLIKKNGLLYLSFMPQTHGKNHGYEITSFSEEKIYFYYHSPHILIPFLEKKGFVLVSSIEEDYEEEDGSLTIDLFLIFRKTVEENRSVL